MTPAALQQLTRSAGLPDPDPSRFTFTGSDPVLRTPYRVGTAGAAALGAVAVAVADLWELRTGRKLSASVDLRATGAAMRAMSYLRVDGAVPPDVMDPFSGYYRAANGRWFFLHANYPHHRAAAVRVLRARETKESVAQKILESDAEALESALMEAGGCGAFVRTAEEWQAHPHYAYVAAEPLVAITKIGEAPAEALAPGGKRPLAGIRVLDLTRVVAGPTCARTLAEHGAQVLKITRADLPTSGTLEIETGFGKHAADLDLRDPAQKDRLCELVRGADVFSQGYRPGTLAAKGFGPEALARLRPGIVCTSLCAWGRAGPWRHRRGYDTVVQSATGMGHATGLVSDDPTAPRLQPASPIDYIAGWAMAFGSMVALARRAREGGSWQVDVSLAACGHWLTGLGRVGKPQLDRLANEFTPEELARWTMKTPSTLGELTHLRPVVQLSETVPGWSRAPVPVGSDPAAWPAAEEA